MHTLALKHVQAMLVFRRLRVRLLDDDLIGLTDNNGIKLKAE